jgi:hypothetical protein
MLYMCRFELELPQQECLSTPSISLDIHVNPHCFCALLTFRLAKAVRAAYFQLPSRLRFPDPASALFLKCSYVFMRQLLCDFMRQFVCGSMRKRVYVFMRKLVCGPHGPVLKWPCTFWFEMTVHTTWKMCRFIFAIAPLPFVKIDVLAEWLGVSGTISNASLANFIWIWILNIYAY